MTKSFWIISTNTKTKLKCERVIDQLIDQFTHEKISYKTDSHAETKDFFAEFELNHDKLEKPEILFDVLLIAQSIGYYWNLFGSIESQCSGRSEDSKVSGVTSMEWHLEYE